MSHHLLLLLLCFTIAVSCCCNALSTTVPKPSAAAEASSSSSTNLSPGGGDIDAFIQSYRNAEECPPTKLLDYCNNKNQLPRDFPAGTYFRNGAGRFEAQDGTLVMHMFDGDGMINAVTFTDNKEAFFQSKFIETEAYQRDMDLRGMSQRGLFGTKKSGGLLGNLFQLNIKHIANTNVVYTPNKPSEESLYALWEGGRPYKLDPATLKVVEGRGEDDLNGVLAKGDTFSAHPRFDPTTNTWVNFGVSDPDVPKGTTEIKLYEVSAEDFTVTSTNSVSITVPGVALFHDFILTQDYAIFSWNEARLNTKTALKAMLGFAALVEAIEPAPTNGLSTLLMIPRHLFYSSQENNAVKMDALTDPRVVRVSLPYNFNFHFGNAYQTGNNELVFDMVQTTNEDFDFGVNMMRDNRNRPLWENIKWDSLDVSTLARYRVDIEKRQLLEPPQVLCSQSPEFPTIPISLSTKPHRYTYCTAAHQDTGASFPGSLCKVDGLSQGKTKPYESFTFEPAEFVGEPAFIPKVGGKAEDAGYLIAFVSNGRDFTSELVVLDVEGKGALERGPVARIKLPTYVPNGGLHGRFVEGATLGFGSEEAPSK